MASFSDCIEDDTTTNVLPEVDTLTIDLMPASSYNNHGKSG